MLYYEEISPEQARQLLDLYVSPGEWQEAIDFMRDAYGQAAYKLIVEVDLGEEYDDEHEYYTSGEVTCVDRNGVKLAMDPIYCQQITQALGSEQNLSDEAEVDNELVREAIFSYEKPLLPMKNATYIIDQPPTSLPILAIRQRDVLPKPQEASPAVVSTSIGRMRPATYHEITAYLRNLEEQAAWKAVRDFAYQLFGEQAHHVEIETGDEYDDEHYHRVVEDVNVYDADNNPLPYDLTLPYWSQVKSEHSAQATSLLEDFEASLKEEEAKEAEPLSQEEREQLLQEYAHEYVLEEDLYANEFDLPREDATFVLGEPPAEIISPTLYVLFDQEAKQQSVC